MNISWQSYYDGLLPEDFVLSPIGDKCNTDIIEEFLTSLYEDEGEKYERELAKEGIAVPSIQYF